MDILISGNLSGLGSPDYYLNMSRRQPFNAQLICDEQPYLPGDCPIVAIDYEGFSPNKIINMRSLENDIYENTIDYHKVEILNYNGSGSYPVYYYPYASAYNNKLKYLITDYNSDSQNSNPLFYQYELLFDAYSDYSGVIIKNIFKNNEIRIDNKEYKVQYSTDYISEDNIRYSDTIWSQIKTPNSNISRVRILLPFYVASKDTFYTVEYEKYIYGVKSYQKELIEIEPIYTDNDFSVTETGVILLGNNIQSGASLSLIKDPFKRITPLDIVTLKNQNSYLTDKETQWKLRLNIGSFYYSPGIYTNDSGFLVNLENYYTSGNIPVTNIKPTNIYKNIIQVKETPIYINTTNYSFPSYKIEQYDMLTSDLLDTSGKFAISINGVPRNDIKIKSIDRKKGFLELNKEINLLDEVELSFYLENSDSFIIENLELNPKMSTSGFAFHINNYPKGLGIAIKAYSGEINYPFIYDLSVTEDNRIMSGIVDVGESPVYNGLWDNNYIPICQLNLNELTPDIIKRTDARRIGGGLQENKSLSSWFLNNYSGVYSNERNWYTDIGNYDGLPLSNSSVMIIHIPQTYLDTLKQKWFNYYKEITDYDSAEIISEREYKHYLDQTIKRYISAGSNYLIVPTISGIISSFIIDLRN